MSNYLDALYAAFGMSEFSLTEVRHRIGNGRPERLLHELKVRGHVARVRRGVYRILSLEERPDRRAAADHRARIAILSAPVEVVWEGPTAVEVWTSGDYWVTATPFRSTYHVGVRPEDRETLLGHLRKRGIPTRPRRSIGVAAVVIERTRWEDVTDIDGEPVPSRQEVLELVHSHPGIYADAEEWFVDR